MIRNRPPYYEVNVDVPQNSDSVVVHIGFKVFKEVVLIPSGIALIATELVMRFCVWFLHLLYWPSAFVESGYAPAYMATWIFFFFLVALVRAGPYRVIVSVKKE